MASLPVTAGPCAVGPPPGAPRGARWWSRGALLLVLCLDVVSAFRATAQPASDVRTYHQWIMGALPSWAAPSPYPLGADLLWWPLRAVHGSVNPWWLLGCTGPATVAACVLLWRTAARPAVAVAVWLGAAGLLERSYWMRLEPVAALAALVMILGVRRDRVAGPALALAAGALVKVWPAFLLPTALSGPRVLARRRLLWFAAPWTGYGLAALVLHPAHATTWLTFTLSRRTQAESPSVLPALWMMAAGNHTWRMTYVGGLDSADVVLGPHLRAARWLLQGLGVLVLAVLAVRVLRRAGRPEARAGTAVLLGAQTAVLLVLQLAGPALSPQYLVWFAPGLAVAAGEGLLGVEVGLWLVACGLTFVEFPLLWNQMRAADPVAVGALTLRDLVLVVLLVGCLRRVWRETRS